MPNKQGIELDERAQEQPKDKSGAQMAHKTASPPVKNPDATLDKCHQESEGRYRPQRGQVSEAKSAEGLAVNLKANIQTEIGRVMAEIDNQKRLIKHHVGNALMMETVEQEMKALHARLSVLEANLAKEG
jgi:hypothetical protein